ncbi:unnamed protein product [Lactuca virosa]|uniref:Uncharacterized protein n=1 Tax=Lactuca virosa TaxID=75947 RepID=A0AAU9LRA2_9ASTR|nr:unnamed protein product [Lactuca virosa]
MVSNDWISFSFRHGLINIYDGLASYIKKWKQEFFFVDASAFGGPMCFGDIADRDCNHDPKLTPEEHFVVDRLTVNFMKWVDPGEEMLEIALLSSAWGKSEKRDGPILQGKDSTLLNRLHRRRLTGISKSSDGPATRSLGSSRGDTHLEVESSIDSHPFIDFGHSPLLNSLKSGKKGS